jgi:hypothetical protein
MTTTRNLIQRLADELTNAIRVIHNEDGTQHISTAAPVLDEARAYLSQPEPEGLTDEELLAALSQAVASFPPIHPEARALSAVEYDWELEARKARAAIAADRARCGRPTTTTTENNQ